MGCLVGCNMLNQAVPTLAAVGNVTGNTTLASLSDEQIIALGQQAAAYMDSQNTVASTGDAHADRLRYLTEDHINEDGQTLNFKVYVAEEVNAFALPDGSIRVYSELMDLYDDEELMFVIGHEIGHVVQGHARKRMLVAYGASQARTVLSSALGDVVKELNETMLGDLVEKLVNAQFSQHQEKEADDYGLQFVMKHGFEAAKAPSALLKLSNHPSPKLLTLLSSHPDPHARANRLAQAIKEQ